MYKVGKKHRQAKDLVGSATNRSWKEGLEIVAKTAHANFDESVDVDIVLGIDPSKGEQVVRGSVLLPHGTGKKVRVLAFAKGEHAEQAEAAGADFIGLEDLIEKILGGWMDFDVAVATPDLMGKVGKVAKLLGPHGLLPNAKVGTVTFDIGSIVKEIKQGRVSFKNDKGGVLHASFGKVSLGADKLVDNLSALVKALLASKPPTAKGKFIRKVTVSSTMGVGVSLNPDVAA